MNFDFKRMLKFEINVGTKEKKMRIYSGAALLFVSLFIASVPLLLIGLILVATGYTGFCPVYSGIERSTVEEE
ncbi:hypothetical protein BJAS_P3781 [Bathymodiolus japonicus methanotrophic gill symbiont]|uniref:YgaP family membrane protein n=1 Tax=Bathymodiolus japonicus methanotrophic gill symbiont TaxID=113269 RepID=UPI001B6A9788|nr:DUF2892 domain-containing protein [Bathymodiolus japonicus methanotrophic gill symbiont]GFO73156.1 hypothetical protein BJAS_P3781 [Bathymodiolus japonicus methanotrophic gill symbiont]